MDILDADLTPMNKKNNKLRDSYERAKKMGWDPDENEMSDPRDHGFPAESEPIAAPQIVTKSLDADCPVCSCKKTFGIKVRLNNNDFGDCWGHYRGCAACEWASAMSVAPDTEPEFPKDSYAKLN